MRRTKATLIYRRTKDLQAVLLLIGLGVTSAQLGGAPLGRAVLRIVFWGLLAMGITALVGSLFGVQTA